MSLSTLTFSKISKPAFFLGNFIRGFLDGSADEVLETFTDAEVTRFKDTADLLEKCKPWENHLKRNGYDEINQALKRGKYEKALKVCTKCITLIKKALPQNIIVPKS